MTDNEAKPVRRKLGAAGWLVLLLMIAVVGGCAGSGIYLLIQFANSLGG